MPTQKRKIGDIGENIAADYLKNNGYKIIRQNYQKPWGEIDIVARLNQRLVFIEVKTLIRTKFHPEQNVNKAKQERLIRTAETYLMENNYPAQTSWQIDIITIELDQQKRMADLKHIKNAIWR